MTATLKRPRQVTERYWRTDGMAAALVYEAKGGAHVVRVLGESSWRYDDVRDARAKWRELRRELRFRGYKREQ